MLKSTSKVSITSDGWSTKSFRGVYCNTITAHLIDEEWNLRIFVLSVSDLAMRHTTVNLVKDWQKVCSEFGLDQVLADM